MLASILAVGWEPELRGLLSLILGVAVWCGSVYLILGTNLGARLGFIVSLTALAGWMALLGIIWSIYGIGLKGEEPSWQPVAGRTVIQEVDLLYDAGVVDEPLDVDASSDPAEAAAVVADRLSDQGWAAVGEAEPAFGQAEASATNFLEAEGALEPGSFDVTAVYEVDPPEEAAWPKFGDNGEFDQLAFFKKPYYTLVEVAPYEPLRTEPGRAPTAPQIDEDRQRQYVYMIRDLGSLRQPAILITIGSSIVFLALCWMLHRRDRFVAQNLARKAISAA